MYRSSILPCQIRESHARVCRAGRRQDFAGDICLRKNEARIQSRGSSTRAEHTRYSAGRNQRGNLVWYRVLNAGVAGSRDVAGIQHVPQRETMAQDQRNLLLARGRRRFAQRECERRPEAVLRVRIIKRLRAGFRRGHCAEDQDFAFRREDGRNGMNDVFHSIQRIAFLPVFQRRTLACARENTTAVDIAPAFC